MYWCAFGTRRFTFATAKKLPSLAAGNGGGPGTGRAKYKLNNEKVFTVF
jgi:hypothetical protein